MERLDGRVALVTGASRGIGAAVSRALDGAGVRLALASRSGSDFGIAGAVAMPTDVRDPASLEALVAATARPRNHRILEVALRPVTEMSWG